MIREALCLTAGFVAGALTESAAARFVRHLGLRIKLRLITDELDLVTDDIVAALRARDFNLADDLTDTYAALSNERDTLCVTLAELRPTPERTTL